MKGKLFFVFSLCALMSRPMPGQVASSTTLVGTVTDNSGAVVAGADVIAVQNATKVSYHGKTTASGEPSRSRRSAIAKKPYDTPLVSARTTPRVPLKLS